MKGKIDLQAKIEEVARSIELTSDPDDAAGIMRTFLDDLINANLTGLELRLFLQRLYLTLLENKRKENTASGRSKLEQTIAMVEHFVKLLGMNTFPG